MLRLFLPLGLDAAKVDDAPDALLLSGLAEVVGGPAVAVGKLAFARAERVDKVINHVDAFEGRENRLVRQRIALDDFYLVPPRTSVEPFRVPREAADVIALLKQTGDEPPTDVTGRAGDKNFFRLHRKGCQARAMG